MARVASFGDTGPTVPGHGGTLAALMQRRKELADQQASFTGQPIQHWMQGVGNLAQQFVTGLEERGVRQEEQQGRELLAKTMAAIDPTTGPTPEQSAILGRLEPDLQMAFIKDALAARREAAKKESYGPVITGDEAKNLGLDPAKSYQLNQTTGQYDQVGGGGTNVTVNPPSAEMAGKLGLANGFLDNYDDILKSAQAGEMTGVNYITSVQFGRGNGGAMYRNLLQGTEAMIRILTGAGMSEGEARQRVTQYEPDWKDDAATLVSKIQGLRQALENVKGGVQTRGRDDAAGAGKPAPAEPAPAPAPAEPPPEQPGPVKEPTIRPDGSIDSSNLSREEWEAWKKSKGYAP